MRVELDSILKKSQDKSWNTLLPDELTLLLASFLPATAFTSRSKAYILLSAFCQRLRETSSSPSHHSTQGEPDSGTDKITNVLFPPILDKLGETTEQDSLIGLTFLTALFQVDSQSASSIFQQGATLENISDAIDLFPTSPSISLAVAQLLGQASGHKPSRAAITPHFAQWLEAKSRLADQSAHALRAAAAVALVKLSRGNAADAASIAASAPQQDRSATRTGGPGDDELVKVMKGLVLSSTSEHTTERHPDSSLGDAVEGLAYLSVDPSIKEALSSDSSFLSRLFAIIPRRKGTWAQASEEDIGTTPLYGTVLIISNLCAYKPRLSEEESQIAKLRKLAKSPKSDGSSSKAPEEPEENPLEDDEHALGRGRRLLAAGVMDALTSAVKATDSRAVRLLVGKTLLALIDDRDSRGRILQGGGAKALKIIIDGILSNPTSGATLKSPDKIPPLDPSELEPIQALAKLSITSSPVQIFGPSSGSFLDAIRPFSVLFLHQSSNLLQQFEAMMALTNLSSASPEAADKIGSFPGLLNKVELLMLEDHTLIRRAATELICNLVAGSETVFARYGGDAKSGSGKSKLHVLVALCDVDDLGTRLAASGALACMTSSKEVCEMLLDLQVENHRILPILAQLVDPNIMPPADPSNKQAEEEEEEGIRKPVEGNPGLVHRGVVCINNWIKGIGVEKAKESGVAREAEVVGLVKSLVKIFKGHPDRTAAMLRPVAEILQSFMKCGVVVKDPYTANLGAPPHDLKRR